MFVLTFQVGRERWGLDVRGVAEVVPRVRLEPASGAPPHVAGLLVYRGRPVPVIDLHKLLGAGDCPQHLSSRIVLLPLGEGADRFVGLLAARVADIKEVREDEIAEAPAGAGTRLGSRFLPEGHGLLRILEPERLPAVAVPS
jgi:chemotaxis-related protein WspB